MGIHISYSMGSHLELWIEFTNHMIATHIFGENLWSWRIWGNEFINIRRDNKQPKWRYNWKLIANATMDHAGASFTSKVAHSTQWSNPVSMIRVFLLQLGVTFDFATPCHDTATINVTVLIGMNIPMISWIMENPPSYKEYVPHFLQ